MFRVRHNRPERDEEFVRENISILFHILCIHVDVVSNEVVTRLKYNVRETCKILLNIKDFHDIHINVTH